MPSLSNHSDLSSIKLLLIGGSGTGKTGALWSLIKAGYDLRILDFDNGLDILVELAKKAKKTDLLDSVDYRTLGEALKIRPDGVAIAKAAKPSAFAKSLAMLDHWKYDDIDLGKPSDWNQKEVLVIDSLSFMSRAAFYHARHINNNPDERSTYMLAQGMVETMLSLLTSASMQANVIVIAHVMYLEINNLQKGFPTTIGKAFSPQVPGFFNTMLECRTTGQGESARRMIHTIPSGTLDLKCPIDTTRVPGKLPIESGLADFFSAMRG